MSVQHWCRACFTQSPDMIPIFDKSKNDDAANVIVEVLQALVGHPILPTDIASNFICVDCLNQIREIHPFLVRCQKSDTTFRQLGESQVLVRRLDDPIKFLEFVIEDKGLETTTISTNGHSKDDSTVLDLTAESGDEIQSDEEEEVASGEDMLECPACLDAFGMISVLRTHLVEVHTMNSQCIICNNATYDDIWKHTRDHVPRKFSCNECEKKYIRSATLERHIFKHIAMRERLTCNLCNAQLDTERNLEDHFDRVHLHCRICSKTMANRKSLLRHKRLHLRESGEYSCETCNRKYKVKDSYDNHMALFHNIVMPAAQTYHEQIVMATEKNNVAPVTDYGMLYSDPLVDPLLSIFSIDDDDEMANKEAQEEVGNEMNGESDGDHEDDDISTGDDDDDEDNSEDYRDKKKSKSVKCSECSKRFNSKQGLQGHMTVHTGEKPFECHICKKAFRVRRNLRVHLISHSKDTPYICGLCGSRFKQRSALVSHMQARHKEAHDFPCGSCDTVMTSINDLSDHLRSAHMFVYTDLNIKA